MFTAKRFYSKMWLSGLLIGLLFIFISLVSVPITRAATAPKITVKAKAGFQNFYKENSWLPLRVDVSLPQGSPDFDGWIEASWANFAADNFVYRRHLQLTPPINRTVWLYLPSDNRSLTQVQFRMTDATGNILDHQEFNVTPLDTSDFMLGVVSDDTSALSYLNQQRLSQPFNFGSGAFSYYGYGSSRPGRTGSKPLIQVVHLTPGDLPTEMAGWDSLDGLALTDLTTLQLNDQSLNRDSLSQAAAGWLAQGRFLLAAGDSGVRRSGFLSNLLPVKLTNAPQTGPFPTALNQFVKADPAPAQVLLAQAGTAKGTSAVVIDTASRPVLASRPFGLGISWFVATDFRSLPDSISTQIWKYVLGTYEPHIGYAEATRLTDSSYFSERWLSQINPGPITEGSNLQSFNVVGLILLAYIILLGPVTYFVLKRWGKRERGWLIIPGLALLFSASLLVLSLFGGSDPLVFSRVAIVTAGQTNDGSVAGSTVGSSVIYANNMAVFGLNTTEQAVAYPMDAINTDRYYDDVLDTPPANTTLLTVQQGTNGGYNALNLSLGQKASFEFEQNGISGLNQAITTNLTVNGDELAGSLQNQSNSDWQNVSVWKPGGQIYSFDELKAGQKVTLSATAKVKQTNQLVQSLIGRTPTYRYSSRYQTSIEDTALNQKASILSMLLGNDGEALPKNTDRLYLIAWKQGISDYGLQIGNHAVKTSDLTLLFEPIAIK